MKHLMPDAKSTQEMLAMLFGADLVVKPAQPQPSPTEYAAIYVGPDNMPGTACLCSAEFAAYAGAALSMMPPAAAKDALKQPTLPEMISSNLYEIMNICSRLFMNDCTPHLRLTRVCNAKEADGLAAVAQGGQRADFEISIPQYGAGRVSFLAT